MAHASPTPTRAADPKTPAAPAPGSPEDLDNLLDEALEESFPASDPIAVTPPPHKVPPASGPLPGDRRHH